MYEKISDIAKIVSNINAELFEILEEEEFLSLNLWSSGDEHSIEFSEFPIWSSECDDREYYDDKDEYEPLDDFVRKQLNALFEKFGKIKLKEQGEE